MGGGWGEEGGQGRERGREGGREVGRAHTSQWTSTLEEKSTCKSVAEVMRRPGVEAK